MGFYWVFTGFVRFNRVLLCFTEFNWSLTVFYLVSRGFDGYLLLLGFSRFNWVFLAFHWVLIGFYCVLLGVNEFLIGCTGFSLILHEFYWVLLRFHRVYTGFTRFY